MRLAKLILALLFAVPSFAVIRFVDDIGTDSGNCTVSDCLTFKYVYGQSDDGDVIKVKAGTYAAQKFDVTNTNITTTGVTFQPDDGVTASQILIQGVRIGATTVGVSIGPIELKSMTNTGTNSAKSFTVGLGAHDVVLTDMLIYSPFTIDGNVTNFTMIGGEYGNYVANDNDMQIGQHTSAAGVTSPKNMLFDGVWFHDTQITNGTAHLECMQPFGYDGLTVRNSKFTNCGKGAGPGTVVCNLCFTGGVQADEVHRNVLIENNFFGDNPRSDRSAQYAMNGPGANPENIVFRNNTFVEIFYNDSPESADPNQVIFYNNIFSTVNISGSAGPTSPCARGVYDYNHYEGGSFICGTNTSTGTITYVDEAGFDLHLTAGSAAIDTGNAATCSATDYDTHTRNVGECDKGADEFGSSAGAPTPPTITTTSCPNGTAGVAYSCQLAATEGTLPYTWDNSAGTLPTGLTISSAGLICCTPTTEGVFNWTSRVTDNGALTDTQALTSTITVIESTIGSPIGNGFLDRAFPSTQIEAIGGTPAYTWDISAGVLTTGLSLSAGGVLSGTPTALGTFNFTVRVTDSLAVVGTRDYQMIITAALNTITPQSYMGGVIPR